MSQNNTFNRLKKSSTVFFGLILGLLVSSDVLAECALAEGYKLPNGVVFDEHCEFDGELAPVIKGSKYGFIDKQGVIKIPTQYDFPIAFVEGLAAVKKNEKFGFIDRLNNIVIPIEYYSVTWFSGGLAVVNNDDKFMIINRSNQVVKELDYAMVFPFINGLALVYDNGKHGFIDKNGDVAIELDYDDIPFIDPFKDGTAYVKKDGEWFYINRQGKHVENKF